LALITTTINAAVLPLEGRLETALGSGVFLAYYDPNLDITWLADANAGAGSAFDDELSTTDGVMTWANANAWAASLTLGGMSDWRLPTTLNLDSTCDSPVNSTGFNCTGSEMGYLYYEEGITGAAPGPFSNLQSSLYWSGTEFVLDPTKAWFFNFFSGIQISTPKFAGLFAWAVHSGDVPAVVPVPAAVWLFGSGLLGLVGMARRKKAA
jgi:hypothetical protein